MRKLSSRANAMISFIYGLEKGRGYENPKVISRGIGTSLSVVSQIAKTLESKGLLSRRKIGSFVEYSLTKAGELYAETLKSNPQVVSETLKPLSESLNPVAVNSEAKSKGIHKLMLSIPYKNPMPPSELEQLATPYLTNRKVLKHQTILVLKVRDRTFELTASSLIVHAIPRFVAQEASIQALHDELLSDCLKAAEELESEFKAINGYFKLSRRRKESGFGLELVWTLCDEHIPYVNDEVAKAATEAGEKVGITHPGTDQTCITVEHSKQTGSGKPIPEIEFKGATTALPHANDYSKLVDSYEHGLWDPFKEREARLEMQGILHETVSHLNYFAKTFVQHEEAYRQNIETNKATQETMRRMNRVLDKLDRTLSQRRLL